MKKALAAAVLGIVLALSLAAPAGAHGPVTSFPFPLPACGRVAAGTYAVTAISDDGYPRVRGIREFTDAGSYVATLGRTRYAGRYFDHFTQRAVGHVVLDAAGNVTSADDYTLHRIIVLWDRGRFLIALFYDVHLYHYRGQDIAPARTVCR